jgi:hypothetical protein
MLKTGDDIVGVARVNDVAVGCVVSPPLGPQVETVVKVDVGERRRNDRPLRNTSFAGAPLSLNVSRTEVTGFSRLISLSD